MSLATLRPPSVSRGAKTQAVSIACHWLRGVLPSGQLDQTIEVLDRYLGPATRCKGRYFCEHGRRYGSASGLYWRPQSHEDDGMVVVDITGEMLESLGDLSWNLLLDLYDISIRLTRFDIAVDYARDDLITKVHDACLDGCLCRAKVYGRQTVMNGPDLAGDMVTIGRRGSNGSGRYVRIYDKALESGVPGPLTRWETEFSGEHAHVAFQSLCEHLEEGTHLQQARRLALSAIEFREPTGRTELERRPLIRFYASLLRGHIVRTVVNRQPPTIRSYCEWIGRSVFPTLKAVAREAGVGVDEVLHILTGDDPPDPSDTVRHRAKCISRLFWDDTDG